jgi:hypothetical protein
MPLPLLLPPSPLPSSLPTTLIAIAIALFVSVAVACPPPSLPTSLPSLLPLPLLACHPCCRCHCHCHPYPCSCPLVTHLPHCYCHCPRCLSSLLLPLSLLPLPSLLQTTLVTNIIAICPSSLLPPPSPLPPLPSLLLPSSSAARSCHSLLPAIVVVLLLLLSCQSAPTFDAPVVSLLLFFTSPMDGGGMGPSFAFPIQQTCPCPMLPGFWSCCHCDGYLCAC